MDEPEQTLDDILGQTAWIRGLARRLVSDAAERDDIVQEAWIETLKKGRRARALRPWLFGVVRNIARSELRRDSRRRAREEAVEATAEPARPDELVERVELEREVASALLEVEEPYRATLLLRYYQDLSPAEIARRLKIPAGTVRWRLKEALERLRDRLDARFGGDRRRWALALVPTAAAARGGLGKVVVATVGGILVMKVTAKVAAAIVIVLLFVAGGVALWRGSSSVPSEVSRAKPGVAWRVPGGIGAPTKAPPTVAGVALPSWFGQRGAPLRRIAGRVTFGGEPVAGATVELDSDLTDAGLIKAPKIRTGSDGKFDFGTQPPSKFSVAATAAERSPAIVEVDTRNPTSAAERLELRLGGCESALFGHVDDAAGGPIAGAQLCLAPPRASACVSADAQGAYSMCLAARQDIVTVAANGYGAIFDRLPYVGHRVQRDYALTPEAIIVGRVVRADDNAPVAGASVRVEATDQKQHFAAPGATTTSDDGRFSIAGLASGRYRMRAFAEGLVSTETIELNLEAGHRSGEVVMRLAKASRLSGVVTDGRDPIVGATVSLGMGAGSLNAVTQSDGGFVIDPVGRGLASIHVRDYEVRTPKTITIDRSDVSGVRVLVDQMGSIAGRVTYQGKPAAGAQVFPSMNLGPTIAEADGSYVVHGLPPGRYLVSSGDATNSAFGHAAAELTLGKGEHRTGVDIEINYAGAISGVLVEGNGAPVAGAAVVFEKLDYNDAGTDMTGPDGSFRVRSLMGGEYRPSVRSSLRGAAPLRLAPESPATVTLKDGTSETTGVRLVVIRDHASIAGSIVDGGSQPIGDVRVVAFRSDDPTGVTFDDWFEHPSTISAPDGSYSIGDLDAGSYVVRARAGDGSEGVARNVAAGQKGVVVTLQRAGAIDGTLVGFSSQPAVRAVRQLGINVTNLFATVEGNAFHFRGLTAGSYQVAAVGAESDAKSVEVAPGQTATVTLQSRGSTTIRGRVVDWIGGAGVVGMRCHVGLRSGQSLPTWIDTVGGFSDDNGSFVLEGAPTGEVTVVCAPDTQYWSDGICNLTLTGGQDGSCDMPVVKLDPNLPMEPFGGQLDPSSLSARFSVVQPHGVADRAGVRAGDVVTSVDGANVTRLTPWAVTLLIRQRRGGATAHLGLLRGGQSLTADVVVGAP